MKILTVIMGLWLSLAQAAESQNVSLRVGVLQYGTLNWEMDLIEQLHLDDAEGLTLQRVPLASPQALLVALQGDAVDIIINDWLWVARQQEMGQDYYFFPYSIAAGVLVTHPDAQIDSLAALQGKTLGVAGGTANKNWLLYKTFLGRETGLVLGEDIAVKFAAPPMLNALMEQGKLDGVINFWHYAAQLNQLGMPTLLTMPEVLKGVGIQQQVPLLGWVFKQTWANAHPQWVNRFLTLSFKAKHTLVMDDDAWNRIPSFTSVFKPEVRPYLMSAYRAGVPVQTTFNRSESIQALFSLIRQQDPAHELTGTLAGIPDDIFWQHAAYRD